MREVRSICRRPPYGRRAASRRGTPDTAVSAALVHCFAELEAAVARHAAERRAEGASLEQVLAEVAGLVELAKRLEGSPGELGVLLGRVRLWSLAAYVDVPELRHVPRFY